MPVCSACAPVLFVRRQHCTLTVRHGIAVLVEGRQWRLDRLRCIHTDIWPAIACRWHCQMLTLGTVRHSGSNVSPGRPLSKCMGGRRTSSECMGVRQKPCNTTRHGHAGRGRGLTLCMMACRQTQNGCLLSWRRQTGTSLHRKLQMQRRRRPRQQLRTQQRRQGGGGAGLGLSRNLTRVITMAEAHSGVR